LRASPVASSPRASPSKEAGQHSTAAFAFRAQIGESQPWQAALSSGGGLSRRSK
jgi:hypothetical protein